MLISFDDLARAEDFAAALEDEGFATHVAAGFETPQAADAFVSDDDTLDAETPHVLLGEGTAEDCANVLAVLPADAPASLVAAALRLAAAGYRIVPIARTEQSQQDGEEDAQERPQLSQREREVLALLAEGAPNKVIARRLDISVHTAKFHVAAILAKLGAANRTDAIGIAMREGLVLI